MTIETEIKSDQASATGPMMSGAEMVIKTLVELGVDTIFGYPGGAVLPLYDEIFKSGKIRHILVRHEQAATHAAEGYARSTGKPGVVLVTSGPGATNTVTGLTDAMLDSIPMICLTGQVARALIGNDAFQEADTVGITRPCTKHNYLIKETAKLPALIHEAFYVATSGRPGPVVIDIPKDVQVEKAEYQVPVYSEHRTYRPQLIGDDSKVREAARMFAAAKRPIFYTGGGIINSGPRASELLREFAAITGYPVTSTLMGLGALPATDKQWLGMLGMHGTWEANHAMHDCDVMLNIGARFDDRVTANLDGFSPSSKKIHVDIDLSSINKNVAVDIGIVGDAATVLEQFLAVWREEKLQVQSEALATWWKQIDAWRDRDCLAYEDSDTEIMPQKALERLHALTADLDPIISTEVGQHQMWAAQFIGQEKPNKWLTSGGLGTMGYGLPAAIGAQIAHPEALVIDVAGEASIQMNIQELGTASQYNLPVKVFVLNNEYMGMVRQWQELNYESRYSHSYSDSLPDFVALAEAYGWKGILVSDPSELDAAIKDMIAHDGPVFVDCRVAKLANCFPMVPAGAAHHEMLLNGDIISTPSDEDLAIV